MSFPKAKLYPLLTTTALVAGISANASPLISIGDSTNIYFTGEAATQYNDNLFLAEQGEVEDINFDLTPGFELQLGRPGSDTSILAYVNETFRFYADNDDLNNELLNTGIRGQLKNDVLMVSANLGYGEADQTIRDLATNLGTVTPVNQGYLIERASSSASTNMEYKFSPKTSVTLGASFSNTDYDSDHTLFTAGATSVVPGANSAADPSRIRNDLETFVIPVGFYYKWKPKLDVGLGYRYRKVTVKDSLLAFESLIGGTLTPGTIVLTEGVDTRDHFLSVNLRGEFNPKLAANIQAGVLFSERYGVVIDRAIQNDPGFDPEDVSFSMLANLNYTINSKNSVSASFDIDNRTSSLGLNTQSTNIGVGYNLKINPLLTAGASFGVEFEEFGTAATSSTSNSNQQVREDDFWRGSLSLVYKPVRGNYNIRASYSYNNNNSELGGVNNPTAEFTRNIFTLSAGFRY